ncbi:hypothetical protein OSB04_un000359 [Centaurea solstitialis]|uniref:Integrase catalytic domain-containing protein n=1 Tax=Centaurea solstitialis TaxID=347529 RepID=A0AA38W5Z7_9ASTR|nr:hypothetical protein OSB04_un000359 [Centaurea solstitialis]
MADDQENEMNPFAKLESYVAKTTVQNAKFEVEKFDGTNNFGMWQCEVKDVLAQQELGLALEEKPEEMSAADWNRINKMACSTIRLCLAKQQKFNVMRKHQQKSYGRNEEIKDEDKALILLNSLPDSYAHLTTTLLHGKVTIGFEEVSNALMNYEIRHADKAILVSEPGLVHALTFVERFNHSSNDYTCGAKDPTAVVLVERRPTHVDVSSTAEVVRTNVPPMWLATTSERGVTLLKSQHMCPNKNWFSSLNLKSEGMVQVGDDYIIEKEGFSIVKFKHHDGVIREFKNIWYVPKSGKNLISLGALEADGYNYSFANGRMKVERGALVEMKPLRHSSHLYVLQGQTIIGAAAMVSEAADCDKVVDFDASKLWHLRLGHAGENALQGLAKQGLLKGVKNGKIDFCEQCVFGKQTKVKFGTTTHQTNGIIDYVHSDVWGPTRTASKGGKHYFVSFIDDAVIIIYKNITKTCIILVLSIDNYSRRYWVYTMKHKYEVLSVFLTWKNMIENQTGMKIKVLRTDNGGEYTSDPFHEVCRKEGIVRHFTVPRTPQQNRVAERLNRTLLEKVRCMLLQASLDKSFWAEAITYASHIVNRLPSTAINGNTPIKVWTGKHAFDYDDLRIFGCITYFHVTESKLDARAKKAIFVGFSTSVKRYRLWCPELKKLVLFCVLVVIINSSKWLLINRIAVSE